MQLVYNHKMMTRRRQILRHQLPKAEVLFWLAVKGGQILNTKFRRQYSVGPYVIDFYAPQPRLAVEIDGDSHFLPEAAEYDEQREAFIRAHGISLVRFTNDEIYDDLESVLNRIRALLSVPSLNKEG